MQGLRCGVGEDVATVKKERRILEALEPLLTSGDQLWAHVSVLDGPLPAQMRDWNPTATNQADDYLDATAGAVTEQPERISKAAEHVGIPTSHRHDDGRTSAGVHQVLT